MIRQMVAGALALCAMIAAPAARAEWHEAMSPHFVLYAEGREDAVRRQAVALERLDWGLRHFMSREDAPVVASNKLTVFVTSDQGMHALCNCDSAAGFYIPRVGGSVAFAERSTALGDSVADSSRIVLFHEYAHHFLLGSYDLAFPAWYSEGFAEFASTLRITDTEVTIGHPAQHRAGGLYLGNQFSVQAMLDPALHAKVRGPAMDAFYGRGWLLTHYLTFKPERFRQFSAYLQALNSGRPAMDAAREGFGDLKKLNGEVDDYLRRNRIPGLTMPYRDAPPPIALRALGAGEAAMIKLRMESVRGVDAKRAAAVYRRAAPIAARFPDDAVAQGWFAEMAYDAGEDAAARAAVAHALAKDPRSVQALLYQGRLALREAARSKATDPTVWTAARRPIVAANRLDPDDAEPLWLFYTSFAAEGATPRASALAGLYRAQALVPQDPGVRFAAAVARVKAGEMEQAKRLIRPIAYSPHAGPDNPAARMLAALEAGKPRDAVLAAAEGTGNAPE